MSVKIQPALGEFIQEKYTSIKDFEDFKKKTNGAIHENLLLLSECAKLAQTANNEFIERMDKDAGYNLLSLLYFEKMIIQNQKHIYTIEDKMWYYANLPWYKRLFFKHYLLKHITHDLLEIQKKNDLIYKSSLDKLDDTMKEVSESLARLYDEEAENEET